MSSVTRTASLKGKIDALIDAVGSFFGSLLWRGGIAYDSLDMKKGINVEGLVAHADCISPIVQLDPRGGFISQKETMQAIAIHAEKNEYKDSFAALVGRRGWCDFNEGVKITAYSLRVMVSHTRIKRDQYLKISGASSDLRAHPEELRTIYEMFQKQDPEQNPPQKTKHNLHPMPFFRDKEEEAEDMDESDEESIIVMKSFDYASKTATALLSDGTTKVAVKNVSGENGFIKCLFADGTPLETEVPNKYLQADGTVGAVENVNAGDTLKRKEKAKPKTKKKAMKKAMKKVMKKKPPMKAMKVTQMQKKPSAAKAAATKPKAKTAAAKKAAKVDDQSSSAEEGTEAGESEAKEEDPEEDAEESQEEEEKPEKTCDVEMWDASFLEFLPPSARPQEPLKLSKNSYTLRSGKKKTSISVILNRRYFYIHPVVQIPAPLQMMPGIPQLSVNNQKGVQVAFGQDPYKTWSIAQMVAGWVAT